jgi:putative ABC transport system permease protein
MIESLVQDVRFALRQFRKNPGFSVVAVASLALGIGANASIFGLVDSAMLRALPFRQPELLVHVWAIEQDGEQHTPTPAEYEAVREQGKSYEQVAAAGWQDFFYDADDASVSQTLPGRVVTQNLLTTLGVQPLLGRNFRAEEQSAGQDAVVMLSDNCWHTRFQADPHIVGKRIVLNRRGVVVVAVLPPSLGPYYEDVEIFAPLVLDSYASQGYVRAGKARVEIVARLRQGLTLGQARSEADVIAARLRNPGTPSQPSDRLVVEDFGETLRHLGPTRQNAQRGLLMTAAAAGIVLLIACANIASLLMARAVKRHREVAVRAALGCSRARIIRQFLAESAVLSLCGGVVAVILVRFCEEIITKMAAGILPGLYLRVDVRVFAISLAISLLSALAFGIIPALQATRVNVSQNLKDGVANATSGPRSRRLRNTLVAGQVALGMVLLVGFGLLLRSFLNVKDSPLGYDPRNVLTASPRVSIASYTAPNEQARLMHVAMERMRSMPGVESVGLADSLPMQGAESAGLKIETPKSTQIDEIYFVSVSPEYFEMLKVPMLTGRSFRETDSPGVSPVAIVNQTFAKQYFKGASPVGYHIAFADSPEAWREIVGVVSDFRQRNPEEDLRPMVYFPIAQTVLPPRWSMAVRVRAANDLTGLAVRIRDWLRPMDPQLYWELGSMQLQIHDSESLTLRRPMIVLVAAFGALALLLVVIGVFGVSAYSVAERTREIGIRMALGAARGEIARLVLRESLLVAFIGLAAGTLGAIAATRVLPTEGIGWSGSGIFLYGVSRTDHLTYFAVAILLTSVALAASYLPSRRAAKVDPVVALRYE